MKLPSTPRVVFALAAMAIMFFPLFWLMGGMHWLDTNVFPPKRPRFLPTASIWIDAPALPISWHHGWWFGCAPSASGQSDYCRLVKADGEQVYADDYLRCSDRASIPERDIHLVPPHDASAMWMFGEGSDGVIGFLSDGDLLVPKSAIGNCAKIRSRLGR